jgi:DNA repair exonuclease SbcCD ATPase subunit
MGERIRRIDRELAARRAVLRRLLNELGELLDAIAEADADACYYYPAVPIEDVPKRVGRLASEMRRMFDLEEDERHLSALSQGRPELRDRFEQLNAEHVDLLDQLEELYELAGSSVRPGSTWDDIEHYYRGWEQRLASHRRDEESLLAQAGWRA